MVVDMEESLVSAALPKHLARFILSAASCDNLWFVDPISQGLIERLSRGKFRLLISLREHHYGLSRENQPYFGPLLDPPS